METIASIINETYIPKPPIWSNDKEREKYYKDAENQHLWFCNATIDDLNTRTDEEWNNLIEFETGLMIFFTIRMLSY